ncbi:uncharacterized protein LOC106655709 [Trichogramma pretiosum]|uniref:uncharacterized protein LOC106655709 n=1 Tax=Trichogramma pretiosum TaxID=7493 RepID=UPI0006C9AC8C|nr:uncharacterized protein LOC106655709 [Trichogramma pretiosum]
MSLSALGSGFKEAARGRFAKLTSACEHRDFFADLLLLLLLLRDRFIIAAPKRHIERAILRLTCSECYKMSAIPQGAFAALKVRKNQDLPRILNIHAEEDKQDNKSGAFNLEEGRELSAPHYSSKLMNSIWGLYNRYSVHNFKQIHGNEESKVISAGACWDALAVKSPQGPSSPGRDLCGSGPAHIMAQQHRAGH